MGQFSWLDCVTGKPILDNVARTSYVLVPQQFGGGHISERCYDGYGHFGGYDIYDLVLVWNRKSIPNYVKLMKAGNWECSVSDQDIKDLMNYYKGKPIDVEERDLGIILACYDEDNQRLQYPIKITYDSDVTYEECSYSPSDPNQGWGTPEYRDMFYSIECTFSGNQMPSEAKVKTLVTNVLQHSTYDKFTFDLLDAAQMIEWYDLEPGDVDDNVFNVQVHIQQVDPDDDQYILERFYKVFDAAGYDVINSYIDFDD